MHIFCDIFRRRQKLCRREDVYYHFVLSLTYSCYKFCHFFFFCTSNNIFHLVVFPGFLETSVEFPPFWYCNNVTSHLTDHTIFVCQEIETIWQTTFIIKITYLIICISFNRSHLEKSLGKCYFHPPSMRITIIWTIFEILMSVSLSRPETRRIWTKSLLRQRIFDPSKTVELFSKCLFILLPGYKIWITCFHKISEL